MPDDRWKTYEPQNVPEDLRIPNSERTFELGPANFYCPYFPGYRITYESENCGFWETLPTTEFPEGLEEGEWEVPFDPESPVVGLVECLEQSDYFADCPIMREGIVRVKIEPVKIKIEGSTGDRGSK